MQDVTKQHSIYPTEAQKTKNHASWTDFFIFGLVGDKSIDVTEFCPNGHVAQMSTGINTGTVLASRLTLGIIHPARSMSLVPNQPHLLLPLAL
ncbi:Bor/Iss family lipoprotein [Pajaroellobacter abortibovis]|uniref:Bor/Iss family lipoprotein n=1 Tax=Pajaroellobacter abortibovis TaxID=1882918 RepID=UPI0015611EED